MIPTVGGVTAVEAWRRGAELVMAAPNHMLRNLITEITNPTVSNEVWYRQFDPKSVGGTDRLSVVAKVLFPAEPKDAAEGRLDYYERWRRVLVKGRATRLLHSSWNGTYFERLLSLDGSENQIERAIHVLSDWDIRSETAFVAHLSCPRLDAPRPRGAPCLQYIELLWHQDETIDMIALYRNHDFLNKALGNFLGLGRLLNFITAESKKTAGRLICHSARAYTNRVGMLRKLIVQ